MEIRILGGNGLHASETRAVKKMGECLHSSWYGYASLLVVDDQGSMDVDTLVITHDRLLLVELKEWNGKLESSEGRWYLNGNSRGKSPYEIKRVQALRLSKLLQRELQHKLGYFPKVEAHVVLCGAATPDHLSTSERRFVHTLEEFLKISGRAEYKRLVEATNIAYTDLFNKYGKPRPNSASCKQIFQQFFAGSRVRPKEYSYYDYIAEPHPWFKHRQGLFVEYKGHHQEVPNEIALMRRWDFMALGVGNATQDQWAKIALRESRVFSHAKSHERGLEEYLLRPLIPISANDVSEDLTELYELRRTFSRLDEHLSRHGAIQSTEDRLDMVRALILPFAELHAIGIAHRDIDLHNLWYASDQNSILVSGFAASFFPERGTVSDVRKQLQGAHTRLPEDELRMDGDILDPFRQDVFMLGAAAYRVLFPNSALPRDSDGIWEWRKPDEDPYSGQLDAWLRTSLSWGSKDRFANATEMLASLNEVVKPSAPTEEDATLAWNSVTDGDFIKRGWGPYQIFANYPPDHGQKPGAGQVIKYRCTIDGTPAYLKFWQHVAPNATTHGLNRRIAVFRMRAERVAAGGLPTPALRRIGLLESGGLFVVTRVEAGDGWKAACANKPIEFRRRVASALIRAVLVLHDQQIGHGDIHPGNLLVSSAGDVSAQDTPPTVLLLDLLDFGEQTQPFNVEYGPINPAATDIFARDRFAVYKLVDELLADESDVDFKKELCIGRSQPLGIPVSLAPLHDEVQRLLLPPRAEPSTPNLDPIVVVAPKIAQAVSGFVLEQDDGSYHFNCRWDKRNDALLNCYVTGINGSITFVVDPAQRQLRSVRLNAPIALSDLVSASNKSSAAILRPLKLVQNAPDSNGHGEVLDLLLELDPVVSMLEARFAPPQASVENRESSSSTAATEDIWRALLQTEQESLLELEIVGDAEENRNGKLRVPYRNADSRPMDFDLDDRVFVSTEGDDTPFALLDVQETTPDELFLEVTRSDAKRRLRQGSILRLESIQNRASRDRRAKAMERVLDRASVIPRLASFFDSKSSVSMQMLSERPSAERIKELYSDHDQTLNERQADALMDLVERGPVGVLQGPPGTGKTAFVGILIHYLFSELRVRNILLVGQSHIAVDAVAKKARAVCERHALPLSVVRMGQVTCPPPAVPTDSR